MKQSFFEICSNLPLTGSIRQLVLSGDTSGITSCGQFVNIRLAGKFLRRPLSVCDYSDETVTLIYKVAGSGTEQLSRMSAGEQLDLLTGLGNGFSTRKSGKKPLLIGGGTGISPLYRLCRDLIGEGKDVSAVLGFNTAAESFYIDEFKALGADVIAATVDGTLGTKGFVTDALPEEYSYFYCCGPEPMLKAVFKASKTGGQFSFEERMGCGFGACMGCSCKTVTGFKRICKDGPVLEKEEILWEN